MNEAEQIYAAYLTGFSTTAAGGAWKEEFTSLPEIAAFSLGQLDRASAPPALRHSMGVLDQIAKLVPVPRAVPANVDAMMLAGAHQAAEIVALKEKVALLGQVIAKRDTEDAELRKLGGEWTGSKTEASAEGDA